MTPRTSRQALFCCSIAASLLALAGSVRASTALSSYADQVYTSINSQRAANGVAPLARLQTAELEATLHAMDMANRNYMDHYTLATPTPVVPDPQGHPSVSFTGGMGPGERLRACGFTYDYYGWGENVAYNYGYGSQSPQVTVDGWMNSPGHRDNILNASYQGTGVGCAQAANGYVYYCQVFVVYTAGQPTISGNAALWSGSPTPPPPPPPPPPGPAGDITAPAGWTSFSPSVVRATTVTCRVRVTDGGSGLNVTSARYRYRSGTASYSGWLTATCTGTSGSTAQQEIDANNVPFNVQSNQNRIQFQVSDQAGNVGTSPEYTVTTDTAGPAGWTAFTPVSTTSITPTCTVQVTDPVSGLNVSQGLYRYSNNGGYTWSGWRTAACTGTSGTTAAQTLSAPSVPFNIAQSTGNKIQFAILDVAGTWGISSVYSVNTRP